MNPINLYYISKFLLGLRFFVPIWMLFGLKFFSLGELSLIESITFIISVVVDIPSGALADLIGRKKVIIAGTLLMGLGHILLGTAVNQSDYIIFSLLTNIGASFIAGSDTALIFDYMKQQGKSNDFIRVQSIAAFIFRVGIIIASFLGGYFYQKSPALPFLLMGIAEILSIICWLFIKEDNKHKQKFNFRNYFLKLQDGAKEILHNKYLSKLTLFYILIGGVTLSSLFFFNYSYAVELGLDANAQSLLFGFTGIAKALVVLAFALFAYKVKSKPVYFWFTLAIIITYLPAYFAPSIIAILIITASESIAASRIAVLDKFLNDELSSLNRATSLSTINMAINVTYLVLVGVGGQFAGVYGTAALYSILGVICLLILPPLTYKLLH